MISVWTQLAYLAMALGLCLVIGLEREYRQKSAGLRTHTLVGVGAAVFMMVSKYGFSDVLSEHVTLDPSRVAAQIVSGIGFIGGGLIFVRRDAVRGLTTAASIWVAASVGSACGAGLGWLGLLATIGYLIVTLVFPVLVAKLPHAGPETIAIRVSYLDGRGLLRQIMAECVGAGFDIVDFAVSRGGIAEGAVGVRMEVRGRGSLPTLLPRLGELSGVLDVGVDDGDISV